MENLIYKRLSKFLPEFFEIRLEEKDDSAKIFDVTKKIIDFDSAYVFFKNSDNYELKFTYGKAFAKTEGATNFDVNSTTEIITNLDLDKSNSFISTELKIRGVVFGTLILCREKHMPFDTNEIEALDSIATIISYLIKDIELSNVFKLQVRALRNAFDESNESCIRIEEQNRKILEAEKVKDEFLANISHELRTPLNAIINSSEMLSMNLLGKLNDKQSRYVNDIHVSSIHLLGMINEILDISKIESNEIKIFKTNFDISVMIDEVYNILNPLAERKKIEIKKVENDGLTINADFQKLRQVLYNLVSNAIKFTQENGAITISATSDNGNLILSVQDNGIGIEEQYHERIFEKFFQIDNPLNKNESSTGLGLPIVKRLIELHNGKISLQSEAGQGSKFIISLPLE